MFQSFVCSCVSLAGALLLLLAGCLPALGQLPVHSRISRQINPNITTALRGTINPRVKHALDAGLVSPSSRLAGMTMYFRPSAAQQAELDDLVQQQQTPGSPLYHKWITPAEYASRFGLSDSDLQKVQAWLEQQGFTIDRVAHGHNAITFSGTVGQVESAFQTQIHHYNVGGVVHRANAGELSIPSALAGVVLSVRNISDFRPHPLHRFRPRAAASPQYTINSGSAQYHFLAPGDFATIYDVNALYGAGYTGSGQTIVVTGQTAISATDITNFQKAAGLPQKTPKMILVPNTGASTVDDSSGDEDESDLDVEWSGAIAKGASISFVYVGGNNSYSVFDAIQYAVDNNLAPIISTSYGACEVDFPSRDVQTLQGIFEQANVQGQTIVAAGGDNGATDCEGASNSDQATHGLAVDLPASSPYVTGIGGTEFAADVSSPGSYWGSSNGAEGGSATRYIAEKVWNDTSASLGIQAGGGGASSIFGKPSWQTGAGVPSDGKRDVPDISLNASPNHDGYLLCASGAEASSCSNGFLDKNGSPTVAGGTSFGAPIFAGILAILEQKLGSGGLGNVNPDIYRLAASDYSGAFHDTRSGNNKIPCKSGSTGCTTSPIGYSAASGYDLASGWGSIDVANFVNGLGGSQGASNATTTALTASTSAPVVNSAITLTATVSSESGGGTPSGSIQFVIDGTNAGAAVPLSNGSATYTYTPTTAGTHTVVANFTPSNPAANAASSGTLNLTVAASSSGELQISAADVMVERGSSGVSTVTITNKPSGFTGSVALSVSAPPSLTNACFTYVNPTATSSGSVTVYTSKSSCTSIGSGQSLTASRKSGGRWGGYASGGAMLAGLVLLGLPGFRRRRAALFGAVLLLAVLSFGASGCGSSPGSANSTSNATSGAGTSAAGKYTLTLTGTDKQANLSATTTFTLTVN